MMITLQVEPPSGAYVEDDMTERETRLIVLEMESGGGMPRVDEFISVGGETYRVSNLLWTPWDVASFATLQLRPAAVRWRVKP